MSPAAGWYADPGVPGRLRWWDGTGWTEHVAPDPNLTERGGADVGASAEPAEQTATTRPAAGSGWYADPSGVEGQLRWWDGARWTAQVAADPAASTPARGASEGAVDATASLPTPGGGETDTGATVEAGTRAERDAEPGEASRDEMAAPTDEAAAPTDEAAAAGWYPDPSGVARQLRWWDGQIWTDRVTPDPLVPSPATDGPEIDEALAAIEAVTLRASVLEEPGGSEADASDPTEAVDDGAAPEPNAPTLEPDPTSPAAPDTDVALATDPDVTDTADAEAPDTADADAPDDTDAEAPAASGGDVAVTVEALAAQDDGGAQASAAEDQDEDDATPSAPGAATSSGRIRTRTILLTVIGVVVVGIVATNLTDGDDVSSSPTGAQQPDDGLAGQDETDGQDDDGAPPPAPIEVGDELQGEVPLEGTFEVDLVVDQPGEVTIDVQAGGAWDPVAELTDLDGETVAYNDDRGEIAVERVGGDYYDPLIVTELEPGTYRLIVRGFADQAGPFELRTS